jgi:hypothetical protein
VINAPDEWFAETSDRDKALVTLRDLSGESISVLEGPQSIGSLDVFYSSFGSKILSQYYLAAFDKGVRSFPYFMD